MIYIKSTDGVKLAVYDFNSQEKQTVFLIHGWPLSHKIYEYQIDLLTECGYRVVAADLRGFGLSDTPVCGYSYDQMAEDLYQVVCALRLYRFVLVGFSMGGAIALRYMHRYCGYGVCKLILLSAAAPRWTQCPGYPYGLTRAYVDGLLQLTESNRPELCRKFSESLFANPQPPSAIKWFEDIALSSSGIGTKKALRALRDEDGREDLKWVKVPTRILYGAKDTVVLPQLVELQHEGIPGSRLYTLPESGHGILYDQLADFNQAFLESIAY